MNVLICETGIHDERLNMDPWKYSWASPKLAPKMSNLGCRLREVVA